MAQTQDLAHSRCSINEWWLFPLYVLVSVCPVLSLTRTSYRETSLFLPLDGPWAESRAEPSKASEETGRAVRPGGTEINVL